MDHKISKDMISSGMTPSGEKSQADLGRTQYGSAPSPSKLMDAYKSMYDKKEEVINEHHKKDADGNTIPHEDEEINEYAQVLAKGVAMLSKAAKPVMKIAKKVAKSDTVKNIATQTAIGSAMSGNQKKQTTGTVSASADLFDIVKGKLIDEGLNEKEIKDIMLTLTPDEILNEISVGKMADYISAADKDVQKTATDIQKGKSVMGDDPRVKKMTQRAKGMSMAGTKIAKKLTPPSMP